MVAEIMTIILVAMWNNIDNSFKQQMITICLNVSAVLGNGLVHLHALVGEEVDYVLVHLRALVGEEIYQPVEDSDHALQYGGPSGGATWRARLVLSRRPASGHARVGVVFDMTQQHLA